MLLRGMERRVGPAETLLGGIWEGCAWAWAIHTLPAMLRFHMFAIDRLRYRRGAGSENEIRFEEDLRVHL